MKYTYLLACGFGFANKYWDKLIPFIDGDIEYFDDYFVYSSKKRYVGIGHSIGFLKLNNSGIKFDLLVGLQGFLNFCGNDKVRSENIDRMIDSFNANPYKSLKFFYNICGYTEELSESSINLDELIKYLTMMKKSYKHCGRRTLIIGSAEDDIVSLDIIKDNFANLQNVMVRQIDGVGHSLGYNKPEETTRLIIQELNSLK